MIQKIISAFCFLIASSNISAANIVDLEPLGESYPVIEEDLEEFLYKRLGAVNMQTLIDEYFKDSFKKATTAALVLPPAPKDEARHITPFHTLENEVYTLDRLGIKHVIYPKGFIYNPLDYMKLNEEYIIINADNKAEIRWLKSQDLTRSMVIISEGDILTFSEDLGRPAYILSDFVKKGLHVRYTPSRVTQEGNRLTVYEYSMKREDYETTTSGSDAPILSKRLCVSESDNGCEL